MFFHPSKGRHVFISLIILYIFVFYPAVLFADADRIFRDNNKAVVVIVTYDSHGNAIRQGSGFIVMSNGAVATNYHVISDAKDIRIKAGGKVLRVEGFLYIDKENDLVILKSNGTGLPTVRIGDASKVNIGEKVYVIGSPQGLENTISDGILSGIREITPQRKVLQISAPISEGSSGGPVFNQYGEVIGIATFLIKEAQNLNFAMPANLIKDKIGQGRVIAFRDTEIEDYTKTEGYWLILGYAYDILGKYKEAIDAYRQAIRLNPNYFYAYNNLGVVYDILGMHKEAIEACNKAIRLKPDLPQAHYNLGNSYFYSGKYKEAIESYKQAIKLKPDYAYAYANLGAVYLNLGKHKEGIEASKKAIRLKPDDAMAHYNLGVSYMELNDRSSALQEYNILKDLDTELANKLFNHRTGVSSAEDWCYVFQENNEYDRAIKACTSDISGGRYTGKNIDGNPLATRYVNRGIAYMGKREYQKAIADYKKASELDPNYPEPYYNMACLESLRQNSEAACKWLQKAINAGYSDLKSIKEDRDLNNIRNSKCYKLLNLEAASEPNVFSNSDLEKYKRKNDKKPNVKFRRISLDFQDADLKKVLEMLADIGQKDGVKVIVDQNIRGKTTIYEINIEWPEAISLLANKHNLDVESANGTLFIRRK